MDWYKHYLGDFKRDTSHLSLTERGAYLALIHHYYATEEALPADLSALCRIAGAMTKQERDAVKVAITFFERRGGKLWHKRIEAECAKAEGRSDKNREIALAREERKRAQNVPRNVHEPLHENSTIRTQPETRLPEKQSSESSEGVSDGFIQTQEITQSPAPVDIFPMRLDWTPSIEFEKNLPPNLASSASQSVRDLAEFCSYRATTGERYTQAQWEHKYLQNLEANYRRRGAGIA